MGSRGRKEAAKLLGLTVSVSNQVIDHKRVKPAPAKVPGGVFFWTKKDIERVGNYVAMAYHLTFGVLPTMKE